MIIGALIGLVFWLFFVESNSGCGSDGGAW